MIGLLLLQPVLGYVHHLIYVKEHKRTLWIYSHIWYGRALILLAVINGGLGLQLSGNTVKGEIAYGVIAGVMFLLYIAVLAIAYLRKDKSPEGETGEKMVGGPKSEKDVEEVMNSINGSNINGQQYGDTKRAAESTTGGSMLRHPDSNGNTSAHAHAKSDNVEKLLDRDAGEPASEKAGPHKWSPANKLDPNLDSDRDGRTRTGPRAIEHATVGYDAPLAVRNT